MVFQIPKIVLKREIARQGFNTGVEESEKRKKKKKKRDEIMKEMIT